MNFLQTCIIEHQDPSQFKISTAQLRTYYKLHAAVQCFFRKTSTSSSSCAFYVNKVHAHVQIGAYQSVDIFIINTIQRQSALQRIFRRFRSISRPKSSNQLSSLSKTKKLRKIEVKSPFRIPKPINWRISRPRLRPATYRRYRLGIFSCPRRCILRIICD